MTYTDYQHLRRAVESINDALDEILRLKEPLKPGVSYLINENLHTVGLYLRELMDDGWEEEN